MNDQVRPTGVTILAILQIISGLIAIAFGAFFGAMLGGLGMGVGAGLFDNDLSGIFGIIGGVVIVLGLLSFIMAWGLLKGKSWAWTVTLILTIISLIFDLPSVNIIGIIIDVIILYYLFRPHVKTYFGKDHQVL